jgi:hypothetical protein
MLVFIMVISYQACLVCKIISKSCPHDQFVLKYGLSTKFYIARISGTSSKSENPNLSRQVWSGVPPDKSGPFTRQLWCPWVYNSLTGHWLCIWTLFFSKLLPPVAWAIFRQFWVSPPFLCGFIRESLPSPPRIRPPSELLRFKTARRPGQ